MTNTYRWITNLNKEKVQHFRIVCKALNVDVVIAKYKEPVCIEALYGVYIPNDYESATKIRAIFELSSILGKEYKKRMINRGFATEEELQDKHCYIGCEKEYFPHRDASILRKEKING